MHMQSFYSRSQLTLRTHDFWDFLDLDKAIVRSFGMSPCLKAAGKSNQQD